MSSADRTMGRSAKLAVLENNKRAPIGGHAPCEPGGEPSTSAVSLAAPAIVIPRHSQPPELITKRSGPTAVLQAIDQVRFLLIVELPRWVSEGARRPASPPGGARPHKSLNSHFGQVTVAATGVHYGS